MKWYYLALDLFSLSFPLLRSFESKIKYYTKLRFLFLGLLFANFIFIPWDIWFTKAGIWGFNQDYLLGYYFLHLPLEEWLFFIVIPYACFFIYEAVLYFIKLKPFNTAPVYHALLALVLLVLGFRNMDQTYTSLVFWGCAFTLISANILIKEARWNYFWLMYGLSLIPFSLVNGALTGAFTPEPVVWYNNAENLGIRLFTVPIEDTVYLLFYLLLIYIVYENQSRKNQLNKPSIIKTSLND